MPTFAQKISALFQSKNINQVQAGKLFGVSQRAISGWMAGTMPRRDKLAALAAYFRIDIEVLTDNTQELPPKYRAEVYKQVKTVITNIESLSINDKIAELEYRQNRTFSEDYRDMLVAISMLPEGNAIHLARILTRQGKHSLATDVLFVTDQGESGMAPLKR